MKNKLSFQSKENPIHCKETGTLYLVATPIGNLKDLTFRAFETLKMVDLIACEDTRVSQKLLSHYGLTKSLLSYHDHNASKKRPFIIRALLEGQNVALLSDAGTPLISDPGHKLVQEVIYEKIKVTLLPGPSAGLMGLVLSGLSTNQFFFAGFPPSKSQARKTFFQNLREVPGVLIFYESAQRIRDSLEEMKTCFGNRPAAIARELTKKFEEVLRGTLASLKKELEERETVKGEIVILVDAPEEQKVSSTDLIKKIMAYRENFSLKEAVQRVSQETKASRKQVYQLALELEKKND